MESLLEHPSKRGWNGSVSLEVNSPQGMQERGASVPHRHCSRTTASTGIVAAHGPQFAEPTQHREKVTLTHHFPEFRICCKRGSPILLMGSLLLLRSIHRRRGCIRHAGARGLMRFDSSLGRGPWNGRRGSLWSPKIEVVLKKGEGEVGEMAVAAFGLPAEVRHARPSQQLIRAARPKVQPHLASPFFHCATVSRELCDKSSKILRCFEGELQFHPRPGSTQPTWSNR